MTTLEMIEQIVKHQNKVFRIENNKMNFFPDTVFYNNCLRWDSCDNKNMFVINDFLLGLEWEEVKSSVDFMEAMSALRDGKNVYVRLGGAISSRVQAGGIPYLCDRETRRPISTDEIFKGKWYIKD